MIKQAKKIKKATQKISNNNVFLYIGMIVVLGTGLSWIKWNQLEADELAKKNAQEARARIAAQAAPPASNVVLVDVRTPDEFNKGHRDGAINIPVTELVKKAPQILPDKNTVILLYCRSGNRAAEALKVLEELGYKRLENLHL